MTAISIVLQDEGLVVAADGRMSAGDHDIVSDVKQKIFRGRCKNADVVYCFVGLVQNEQGDYDLVRDLRKAFASAECDRFRSFEQLVDLIGSMAASSIARAVKAGVITPELTGKPEYAGLYIASYFGRKDPSLAIVALSDTGTFTKLIESPVKGHRFVGSEKITHFIDTGEDERLLRYFHPHGCTATLDEAVGLAGAFVSACCDPVASEVDEACHGMGGHVHIASLTPNRGFQWVIAPLNGPVNFTRALKSKCMENSSS